MNESDIRRLTQENRSLAQKNLDAIRDLIRKLKGGESQKLYEMEKLWASALKEGKKNTANEGGVRYSISEIEGEKKKYGTGVILDTDIFNGVKPRSWGRILEDYVYKHMAGKALTMYDDAGNPETVYFAKLNDRVKKDGAKSSHKVIDKLARYNGDNTRALATVHLAEALETSKEKYDNENDRRNENNHQWMDENGWKHRTTYLQDRSGNIYEATLNIADGRDRRILYDINNIRLIDKAKKRTADGAVPSTENGRGSHINSSSKGMVPETSAKSNPQNAEKTKKSLKADSRGRELTAAQQEYFEDSRVLDKSGKLLPVYHTTYDEFTTFDRNRLGAVTDGNAADETMAATAHIGFWFNTQDLRKAYGSGSRAEEVYLNITNPLKLGSLDELYNYVSLYGGDGSAADFAGRMNESDIRRLTQENRSLAQKILDAIRDLIRKLKGGESQKLYEMEKLWASALKEGNKNTAGRRNAESARSWEALQSRETSATINEKTRMEDRTSYDESGEERAESVAQESEQNERGGEAVRRTAAKTVRGGTVLGGQRKLTPSFGEVPRRTWAEGHTVEPVRGSAVYAEQQTAMEYGVPSFVIADDVWDANKGKTPAFSANGQIYFRENVPQKNVGMLAYHELTHVMKQVGYEPYLRFTKGVAERLNINSKAARLLLEQEARHRKIDIFGEGGKLDLRKLRKLSD